MRRTIFIPLLLLVLLDMLFIYLTNQYLITAEVAETAISGDFNETHVRKWNIINDFLTNFMYIKSMIKIPLCIVVLSSFLYLLLGVDKSPLSFMEIMRVAIIGYFVFLLPGIITFFWFGIFNPSYSYAELTIFNPFNLKPYFAGDIIPVFEQAVYKSVSLLDLLFVLLVGFLIYKETGKGLAKSVAIASVPALALVLFSLAYYMV
jgi:hypothetical protein